MTELVKAAQDFQPLRRAGRALAFPHDGPPREIWHFHMRQRNSASIGVDHAVNYLEDVLQLEQILSGPILA